MRCLLPPFYEPTIPEVSTPTMRQFLRIAFHLTLMVVAVCALAGLAQAQEVTGSLVGTVKDSGGAAVSGANVTITDADKQVVVRTVTTNDSGEFSAPNLLSGFYD